MLDKLTAASFLKKMYNINILSFHKSYQICDQNIRSEFTSGVTFLLTIWNHNISKAVGRALWLANDMSFGSNSSWVELHILQTCVLSDSISNLNDKWASILYPHKFSLETNFSQYHSTFTGIMLHCNLSYYIFKLTNWWHSSEI